MPTLRRYASSSSKLGFYLRANVGGNAPVTLQVNSLAEKIFQDVGYSDGDTVPTKLVWAMYDVDLLTTGNSGGPTGENPNIHRVLGKRGVSSHLSEETKKELVEYLDTYNGSHQWQVKRLQRKLSDDYDPVLEQIKSLIERIVDFFSE